jgi:hypothetical protein
MDWLTFISKIIESLAWPSVPIAVLLIIRKELPTIAKSIRRFKYKDVELEFGESAKAVASETKAVLPEPTNNAQLPSEQKSTAESRLEAIAEIAPRAAILEAWLLVEAAAADVIQKKNLGSLSTYPGPLRLRETLQKGNILNMRQVAVFEQLRKLRNDAVHVPDAQFTKDAAINYIQPALAMSAFLEQLAIDS